MYVLKGKGKFGTNSVEGHPRETLVAEQDGDTILATAGDEDLEYLLLAGEPLNEPVVSRGPFVMNTNQEILECIADFQAKKNGFEMAENWQSDLSKN
ncbi:hypothetical protein HDU93_007330, partial [Gonapodya sp. JEL0774]